MPEKEDLTEQDPPIETALLADVLIDYVADKKREYEGWGGELSDKKRNNPMKGVEVYQGMEAERLTKGKADLVLTFDGNGYNFFSDKSEYRDIMKKNERELEMLAGKYGYVLARPNSWSIGFVSKER